MTVNQSIFLSRNTFYTFPYLFHLFCSILLQVRRMSCFLSNTASHSLSSSYSILDRRSPTAHSLRCALTSTPMTESVGGWVGGQFQNPRRGRAFFFFTYILFLVQLFFLRVRSPLPQRSENRYRGPSPKTERRTEMEVDSISPQIWRQMVTKTEHTKYRPRAGEKKWATKTPNSGCGHSNNQKNTYTCTYIDTKH